LIIDNLISGHYFDMAGDSLTLESLFAMRLYRCPGVAEQIIATARRELDIENGVKAIADVWNAMGFIVTRHIKANEDRGYIMGSMDDIVLALDDNSISLQNMAASQ
jgi:dynein heavy chain